MFRLIAGPCVIESEDMVFTVAKTLKSIGDKFGVDFYFKASFDKANRTSIHSYRGPGIKEGINILSHVKNDTGVRIVTDIHEPWQAEQVAEVADIM